MQKASPALTGYCCIMLLGLFVFGLQAEFNVINPPGQDLDIGTI